ncbi:MAG: peptidylprolyl isomerase [Nitrososphaerota archaeon]|jgi:cyclophilin family peptidyl-prolyl cis-trans isomerase|nr:peptidylprolyl isomerase [Nitrososphaerota archaeon]
MAPKYNRKKQAQNKTGSNKGNSKTLYIIVGVLAIVAIIIAGTYFIGGFGTNNNNNNEPNNETVTPTATPNPTPATENTKVLLQTSMGDITLQLFDDKPITTQNFLKLVALGKYDNTIIHRVVKDFVIQAGAVNKNNELIDGNWASINDEIGQNNHNSKYTIAMAKTTSPNSATTSFFINTGDNSKQPEFDDTYTVFGRVIEGQDIVDAIANVQTVNSVYMNEKSQPAQTITITSAKIIS